MDRRFSECVSDLSRIAWDNYNSRSTNIYIYIYYIYARACFTGRLSSFHGPRPRLVSPRSSSSSHRRRRMKVERPWRRERGVNPHERYHRNGTARVVMCSDRLLERPTTPVPTRRDPVQPFGNSISSPVPIPMCDLSRLIPLIAFHLASRVLRISKNIKI